MTSPRLVALSLAFGLLLITSAQAQVDSSGQRAEAGEERDTTGAEARDAPDRAGQEATGAQSDESPNQIVSEAGSEVEGQASEQSVAPSSKGVADSWVDWILPAAVALLALLLLGGFLYSRRNISALYDQLQRQDRKQQQLVGKLDENRQMIEELQQELQNQARRSMHAGSSEIRESGPDRAAPVASPRDETRAPSVNNSERVQAIHAMISEMLASPGFRASDYESGLSQFGTLSALSVGADGQSLELVNLASVPGRKAVAVAISDNIVAIVPSGRFVKDFAMTFKESLEAGAEVKQAFDCQVDGSAALKVRSIARARISPENRVLEIRRGELAGFVA